MAALAKVEKGDEEVGVQLIFSLGLQFFLIMVVQMSSNILHFSISNDF